MGDFPSGQRGQTVNLLAPPSVVRIHHLPPTTLTFLYKSQRCFLFRALLKGCRPLKSCFVGDAVPEPLFKGCTLENPAKLFEKSLTKTFKAHFVRFWKLTLSLFKGLWGNTLNHLVAQCFNFFLIKVGKQQNGKQQCHNFCNRESKPYRIQADIRKCKRRGN